MNQPTMETLPENMHYHILTFADPADLTRVICTSKNLKSAVEEPALWRTLADQMLSSIDLEGSVRADIQKLDHRTVKLTVVTIANFCSNDLGLYQQCLDEAHNDFCGETCDKLHNWARQCYEDGSVLQNVEDFLEEVDESCHGLEAGLLSLNFLLPFESDFLQTLANKHSILSKPSSEWVQDLSTWSAEIESNIKRQKKQNSENSRRDQNPHAVLGRHLHG